MKYIQLNNTESYKIQITGLEGLSGTLHLPNVDFKVSITVTLKMDANTIEKYIDYESLSIEDLEEIIKNRG
jgi:hypothetical protein